MMRNEEVNAFTFSFFIFHFLFLILCLNSCPDRSLIAKDF